MNLGHTSGYVYLTFEVLYNQFFCCCGFVVCKRRCMTVESIAGIRQCWEICSFLCVCHVWILQLFVALQTRGWAETVTVFSFPVFRISVRLLLFLQGRLRSSWKRHAFLDCGHLDGRCKLSKLRFWSTKRGYKSRKIPKYGASLGRILGETTLRLPVSFLSEDPKYVEILSLSGYSTAKFYKYVHENVYLYWLYGAHTKYPADDSCLSSRPSIFIPSRCPRSADLSSATVTVRLRSFGHALP